MSTDQIRTKFLDFFASKGHTIIPSAPVVPEHDPSVLFTTAGMQPLVPYLLGQSHPGGRRLANVQKCIRTTDIDEVGDDTHLTMFEMLGNWSLGDYYKAQSIAWSFEFLTGSDWLGIDPSKLYVSVYAGDKDIPKDDESIDCWVQAFSSAGIQAKEGERILACGRDDNWWEIGGSVEGPAGPDTEIFYYTGSESNPKFDTEDSKFVEIWNNVFMAYRRQPDGNYRELESKNVDAGMGLERLAAVLQGVRSIYRTDGLARIEKSVIDLAAKPDGPLDETNRAARIVTDHLRSGVFMAADGVVPSNTERGYVLRRLIRRAVRQSLILGIGQDLTSRIGQVVIDTYGAAYPEIVAQKSVVLEVLSNEELLFRKTLLRGVREFARLGATKLSGEAIFKLFDTYGFPPELSLEDAKHAGIVVDPDWEKTFADLMSQQKERSRTAIAGQFRGGLAEHSEITTKYHTATHLLYASLRRVLGDHVIQRGSNITAERARFDFSHANKLSPEEIQQVESIVNEQIKRDWPVSFSQMPPEEAFASGAIGAFGDKYGDIVKVYTVGDPQGEWFSREICGGPHVERTGTLGRLRIAKEESSSAGVRRIKAVLE